MKQKNPEKGGRYYKVDGKRLTEKQYNQYNAQKSQPKTKGDTK
jgi:hypothetical protein